MKEGDIYMNGMYHNPNDNWLPQPNGPEEREAFIKAGCLGGRHLRGGDVHRVQHHGTALRM